MQIKIEERWFMPEDTRLEVTVRFANGGSLRPDDVLLISAIQTEGSISAAGRRLDVSYRKCWLMVDALNRMFETPVLVTFPGRREGGAALSPFGARLIALYKSMERRSGTASKAALEELRAALDPQFRPRANDGALEDPADEPRHRLSRRT